MRFPILIFFLIPVVSQGQIQNGDFEYWPDSLYSMNYAVPATNPIRGNPSFWNDSYPVAEGVARVDDAFSGNHAVLIYTWYNYVPGSIRYKDYSGLRPYSLDGKFRYLLGGAGYNQALRYVQIVAWHQGDTLGYSQLTFDTSTNYQAFSAPISYTSFENPDSIEILFYTNGYGSSEITNGYLFLDDLTFGFDPVSTQQIQDSEDPEIYPNPATDYLWVEFENAKNRTFEIVANHGCPVRIGEIPLAKYRLSLRNLPPGTYSLKIKEGKLVQTIPFVIQHL